MYNGGSFSQENFDELVTAANGGSIVFLLGEGGLPPSPYESSISVLFTLNPGQSTTITNLTLSQNNVLNLTSPLIYPFASYITCNNYLTVDVIDQKENLVS